MGGIPAWASYQLRVAQETDMAEQPAEDDSKGGPPDT